MGLVASRQAVEVVRNARYIVAVELLAGYQAAHLKSARDGLGKGTAAAISLIDEHVDQVIGDRPLTDDIETIAEPIADGCLPEHIQSSIS